MTMTTPERTVILSDLQIPYNDKNSTELMIDFVKYYKPDELWCVGDELDAPQASRWEKGYAGEYADTLQRDCDEVYDTMARFKSALGKNKRFIIQRSNHTDRIQNYIKRYAPAFSSLRSLDIEELLGYKKLGIEYLHKITELMPGWVMAHGDEGRTSSVPGQTAMKLSQAIGKSVVCGHTHRLGVQHETRGLYGKLQVNFGLEVGHMMDIKHATYLATGTANWQQGFGILVRKGRKVAPYAVPILNNDILLP